VAALLLAVPFIARAEIQIPAAINYQGKLTDELGNALTNGYYVIEFRIWKDPTQTGVSELAWGRSFPVYVVTGGLFSVLLSNDGSTNSDGGSGDLLTAFGGPSRYLGLTVRQNPSGTVATPLEIKPRQQLVSAPFTIQAQIANTANTVAHGGVGNASLAAGSVTTAKIASGNVTADSLASNAVITIKIADGAVTAAKLDIDGDLHMNSHQLYLWNGADTNHGIGYKDSLGSQTINGPFVYGFQGGALGTTSGGQKAALTWKSDQSVTANGALTVTNGAVSMFGALQANVVKNIPHAATTDGFVIVTALNRFIRFQIWPVGALTNSTPTIDQTEYHNAVGANTFTMAMPVAKGETWQLTDINNFTSSTYLNIFWRPLGK